MALSSCKKKDDGISYSKVSITKFTILNFPATQIAGGSWDDALSGTYPDVYFTIRKSGLNDYLYSLDKNSRIINLQASGLPAYWSNNGSAFFTLGSIYQKIDLDLWDYDGLSSDEYIGYVTVDFTDYTSGGNKYPSTIIKTNGFVSIKLDLIWQP